MDTSPAPLVIWGVSAPWDMICYLLLVQFLPALILTRDGCRQAVLCRYIVVSQIFLIMLFILVWGGYGKDSWEYLPRFDGFTDDDRSGDWLFWIVGYTLNKLFYDPWPLKILSAVGAAILCYSIIFYFRDRGWRYHAVALFCLLLVPAFYLLIGSAVRQGIAGALVVLGIVALHRSRNGLFLLTTALALFIHQTSILFAAVGVLSRFEMRLAKYALAVAPLVSYSAFWAGQVVGIDVGDYVPYSDKNEGQFHFEKFVVAYAIAGTGLFLTSKCQERDRRMVAAYAYMVAASTCFLKYEVVFERLLGYSELMLPLIATICIGALGWEGKRRVLVWLWAGGTTAGIFLWAHPSFLETLGYLNVAAES